MGTRRHVNYCKICGTDTGSWRREYCKDHRYVAVNEQRSKHGTTNEGSFWVHSLIDGKNFLLPKGSTIAEGFAMGRTGSTTKGHVFVHSLLDGHNMMILKDAPVPDGFAAGKNWNVHNG